MTPELAQAIEEFKNTPEGRFAAKKPKGECGLTSIAFINLLVDFGIEGREVFMVGPIDPDDGHEVVLAEGYFIDWTARQYDDAADFPALIEPWPHHQVLEWGDDRWQAHLRLRDAYLDEELEEAAA